VFFLVKHRTPDNLLIHLLQNSQIEGAADLVRLFHILHNKGENSDIQNSNDSVAIVEDFISSSANKKSLQLALDTYKLNQKETLLK